RPEIQYEQYLIAILAMLLLRWPRPSDRPLHLVVGQRASAWKSSITTPQPLGSYAPWFGTRYRSRTRGIALSRTPAHATLRRHHECRFHSHHRATAAHLRLGTRDPACRKSE